MTAGSDSTDGGIISSNRYSSSRDEQPELMVYFYANAEAAHLEPVEIARGSVTETMRSIMGDEIVDGVIDWLGVYATPLNLTGLRAEQIVSVPGKYHAVVVFTTGDEYWWSVEKNRHCVVLQRSKSQTYLLQHVAGEKRTDAEDGPNAELKKEDHAYPGCKISRVTQLMDLADDVKRYGVITENCKHFAKTFFDKMALSETW